MKIKLSAALATILIASCMIRCDAAGQDIRDEAGQMFMEETTPAPPAAAKQSRIPIDLSNVGVPVDPKGHIVPLIDRSAPNGVRQNFSNLEVYSEPAWNFLPAPVYNAYGQPYNFYPNAALPYGMPYAPFGMPYGSPFGMPYYPYGNNVGINLGRNLRLNIGTPGYGWGSPFGWRNPYGFNNPYGGFGGINLNPITNPTPIGANFGGSFIGNPYVGGPYVGGPFVGSPFGYPPAGGLFAPQPFPIYSSPLLGSSLFSAQSRGFGLNLFVPPTVEWQSTSTITPLTPNLDGPP